MYEFQLELDFKISIITNFGHLSPSSIFSLATDFTVVCQQSIDLSNKDLLRLLPFT